MPNIADLYTARARATSPDGTVTAVMALDGITVELAPKCLSGHNTGSLATALRSALTGALAGWRKLNNRVLPAEPDADNAGAFAAFREALARVEVTVEFPLVKLGLFGDGPRVAFAPEALDRHETVLAKELDEAAAALLKEHSRRAADLYESHLEVPR